MRTFTAQKSYFSVACRYLLTPVLLIALALGSKPTIACPFCSAPQLSMAEQLVQAEAALICKWDSGEKPDDEGRNFGKTYYTVFEILNNTDKKEIKVGDKIEIDGYRSGAKGDLNLITGMSDTKSLIWDVPQELSDLSHKYIVELPSLEADPIDRLKFAMKHLESSDPLIADDAYNEFAKTPYEQIVQLVDLFPRENLRKWVLVPKAAPQQRRGLYGMMLGLCGDEVDAENLRKMVTKDTDEFRLGIDGVMGGYLLLTGEEGLKQLVETKLSTNGKPGSEGIAVNETFSAISALRFMWNQGSGKIPKDALRKAMRILVGNENFTPTAILDLARWEDWDYSDELIKKYETLTEDDRRVKRTIIAFFIMASQAVPETAEDAEPKDLPAHAIKANDFLKIVKEKDPKDYKIAERMYR